jgi:hypothetical protein
MTQESKTEEMILHLWIAAGCPESGILHEGVEHQFPVVYREFMLRNGPLTEDDRNLAKGKAELLKQDIERSRTQPEKQAKAAAGGK